MTTTIIRPELPENHVEVKHTCGDCKKENTLKINVSKRNGRNNHKEHTIIEKTETIRGRESQLLYCEECITSLDKQNDLPGMPIDKDTTKEINTAYHCTCGTFHGELYLKEEFGIDFDWQ